MCHLYFVTNTHSLFLADSHLSGGKSDATWQSVYTILLPKKLNPLQLVVKLEYISGVKAKWFINRRSKRSVGDGGSDTRRTLGFEAMFCCLETATNVFFENRCLFPSTEATEHYVTQLPNKPTSLKHARPALRMAAANRFRVRWSHRLLLCPPSVTWRTFKVTELDPETDRRET